MAGLDGDGIRVSKTPSGGIMTQYLQVLRYQSVAAMPKPCNVQADNMIKRRLLVGLEIVMLAFVIYVIGGFTVLRYVEYKDSAIPIEASRTQVRHILSYFTETKVPPSDVPRGFREDFSIVVPGFSIYRYDCFGLSALAIHVVYDKHGHAVRIIPTYE